MPKIIDYADRFDGIREAVYALTLEHGVTGVGLDAVADRLQMSARTIRRLIASVEVLPLLGMQWAEGRERQRFLRRSSYPSWTSRPPSEQALEMLLEQLPGRDGLDDRHVWWHLVLAHSGTRDWARTAHLEQERVLATLSADALADATPDDVRRLHLLVSGAASQICLGTVSRDDAVAAIRGHVDGVLAGRPRRDDGAA